LDATSGARRFCRKILARKEGRFGSLAEKGRIVRWQLATAWLCGILYGCGGAMPFAQTGLRTQAALHPNAPTTTSIDEHIVKIREFNLRSPQNASYSIIIGPDKNLWFTEVRGIVRMTTSGKMTLIRMRPTDSDPGFLTVGPNGTLWASTSGLGSGFTDYQIIRIKPNLRLTVYDIEADAFPTNLVDIGNELYFGRDEEVSISGSDVYQDSVATISTTGQVKSLFQVNSLGSYPYFWLNALTTPDSRIWLYSYEGTVFACSLQGKCKSTYSPSAGEYADNLHPDSFAYSAAAKAVYVANGYTSTIYKFSYDNNLVKKYVNGYVATGYTSLAYCNGDIWVTLGPDANGRPLLGALTPSGDFEYYALPLPNAKFITTAVVCGPGDHIWYLRGIQVGEVLSKI
jgi:streptogramin lyase